jgi:histidinol-phosphatase (PHP family)
VIDLHVHTARCGHATGTPVEYVDAARAAGLQVLCFTDHLPMPAGYPQHYTMRRDEVAPYLEDVAAVAAYSAETGGPEVLAGVEADWVPDEVAFTTDSLAALRLDMVLGSVHFLGDWAFDDPDLVGRYRSVVIDEMWERYFAEVAAAARSGLFDVIAHPDLVKKFGFFPDSDPTQLFEVAAEALAAGGCAVEVNSGGLRKPVHEIYPSLALLQACRRRGVPATMGSDAHAAAEVAAGGDEARQLLRTAGYRSLVVFRSRRAEEVAL